MSIERDSLAKSVAIHPGEMLREEFMVPLGLSANALALALRVPTTRILQIVNEKRGITADTALRLACYFRMTPQFWMNVQSSYELNVMKVSAWNSIKKEVKPHKERSVPQRLTPQGSKSLRHG
jgi:addiction module HigA family antidote